MTSPKIDPYKAKSCEHLSHIRRETKKILTDYQEKCDLVIEDKEKTFEDKKSSLTDWITSINPLVKEIEHTSNSEMQAKLLVEDFSDLVMKNLDRLHTAIVNENKQALKQTRANLGPGLLANVLPTLWSSIPSTLTAMDPLNMSDAIKVQ